MSKCKKCEKQKYIYYLLLLYGSWFVASIFAIVHNNIEFLFASITIMIFMIVKDMKVSS